MKEEPVNVRGIAVGVVLMSLASLMAPVASEARNPHCAGGIQYVVGGLRDKNSGNIEDYQRQMQKAISQLESCATEDTLDYEAIGYLGWAYAEVDSCAPAGRWFAFAIKGLTAKGDKKKAEIASNNRDSYWTNKLNDGVNKIASAQSAYPDFTKKPENDADKTLKAEADKYYQQAIHSLTCASLMRPGNPQTLRNLGSVYLFMADFPKAEAIFREGLKFAPEDSALKTALKIARVNYANQLNFEKRYDEAIAYFGDLIKGDAENSDLHSSLANAHMNRAQTLQGDARKPEFKLAGVSYQRAGELRKDDPDLYFNAAVAYQNAGDNPLAEAMWRAALMLRPEDTDIRSGLAGTLAELGKYPEAVTVLKAAIDQTPKDGKLHRQLGGVYSKSNNNPKATEELMIFLALQNGQKAPDAAATAKAAPAGSEAAKTLASLGTPEEIYPWEAQGEKYESWFYWSKKQAYHFKSGNLSAKSDWGGSSSATGSRN
jgi:tetratricopeptide (TPR) repeat protein